MLEKKYLWNDRIEFMCKKEEKKEKKKKKKKKKKKPIVALKNNANKLVQTPGRN